jgi:hypothetical protein
VFFVVFMLNPFPVIRRASRFWLLRVLFRVFTPGFSRIEFTAFFIADELNRYAPVQAHADRSLVYSIQNVMFLSCACEESPLLPYSAYGNAQTATIGLATSFLSARPPRRGRTSSCPSFPQVSGSSSV